MTVWPKDHCESCRAPIIWTHSAHGKRMPVDYEPSPNGSISIQPGGMGPRSLVLPVAKRFGRTNLHTSHFATCPDASRWRKNK